MLYLFSFENELSYLPVKPSFVFNIFPDNAIMKLIRKVKDAKKH
jgi:hypothetical protein